MSKSTPTLSKGDFPVTGMSCAGCAASVQQILEDLPGVKTAEVNYANATARVQHDESITSEELNAALEAVGFGLIVNAKDPVAEQQQLEEEAYQTLVRDTIWAGVLTIPVFFIGMFAMDWAPGKWISLALSIPILFWFGRHFYIGAYRQMKYGRANMDTLVALSTGIAFVYSLANTFFPEFWLRQGLEPHVYFEAATVIITFVSLGKLLEARAKSNTSSAIRSLIGLQPKVVTVERDGKEELIAIDDVLIGDILLVKPGERIAVDGKVVSGTSYLDESMLTGEPIAVAKTINDQVSAGTVNQKGAFRFVAERVGANTTLQQIIRLVREAQGSKAPIQQLVDRIAAVFVPVVLGIAGLTFVVWMLIGGEQALTHALLTSVSVLVIACPCALGLATPTAIMVGIGKGAQAGILIKDAQSLELGRKVNTVVLDKTGTLTLGKPTVSAQVWFGDAEDQLSLKPVLLGIEQHSEHPLAEAIVATLLAERVLAKAPDTFESITGEGVIAKVKGETYYVGNERLLKRGGVELHEAVEQTQNAFREKAYTTIYFSKNKKVLAVLGLADTIKKDSKEAVANLRALGVEVYMLTGDADSAARAVAESVGITNYQAGVLPSDKESFVAELQAAGKIVAMVGDGINDAQALARADVSVAMGQGSDVAIDVATITLMRPDLRVLAKALRLSTLTSRGIRQNLFWAFVYNLVGIPIAAGLLYPINGFLLNPMIAGGAMALSSVSVVMNSLRLRNMKL